MLVKIISCLSVSEAGTELASLVSIGGLFLIGNIVLLFPTLTVGRFSMKVECPSRVEDKD